MQISHHYWYNLTANFGDALAPVIVRGLVGRELPRAEPDAPVGTLLSLGSILHMAARFPHHLVWGTGYEPHYGRLCVSRLRVAAVRGPLTLKALGLASAVMGDPAILLPRIYPVAAREEGERIFVPHHTSLTWARFVPLRVVSPLQPWPVVVREIASAKFVWCEAMHAAIVATAYGVPWAWWPARHGRVASFKWHDWFGSIRVEPRAFAPWQRTAAERWAARTRLRTPSEEDLIGALLAELPEAIGADVPEDVPQC